MKISISNELIVNAFASARTVEEAYKEILPEIEFGDGFNFNINEVKPINQKWGSIFVENNQLILDINDNLIIDCMSAGTTLYTKFAPILGVAKSMIPMFKQYFKDASVAFVPVVEKYLEEYDYTVEEIKFPGVKVGYMILKKNRNGGVWTLVDDYVYICDEMRNMNKNALRNLRKEAVTSNIMAFNNEIEKGTREPAHMIPNDDAKFAFELLEEKFKAAMYPEEREEETITVIQ